MPYLIVHESARVTFFRALHKEFRAGRRKQNDLVLDDQLVSGQHLLITAADGGWIAQDLGSTHGTLVNGVREQKRLLSDGDRNPDRQRAPHLY